MLSVEAVDFSSTTKFLEEFDRLPARSSTKASKVCVCVYKKSGFEDKGLLRGGDTDRTVSRPLYDGWPDRGLALVSLSFSSSCSSFISLICSLQRKSARHG
ncbi:hypothetical protein GUITHDRAFT_155535 [Guillardia theta CCMP2712]|uniref:Uncharacterized protein n=1 Tax=Guillardia theta (strain CCMP2712) TaxID=905079 RepID=L1IGF4_GUITC|nr:hypothetical protein GUITHDRAFT_155535 [Guillardia theta CCMP2712]EKX35293.1 hypothetical protein GUITHDRAFT_155535 [Guillardia theta CCMP2712]|eukprot:XP_005822273.1 hypothetical protein GUITHDRAFT_155535 [Guillardia theta CCMP2712]